MKILTMMEATEQGPGAGLPVMERRRWLINIICSSVFVAIIFVALRLFSRRLMRQKIWWDDYFIVFAMIGYSANIVICGVLLSMGLGLHRAEINPSFLPTTNKLHLAGQLLYQWSMMAAKTSILLMYYRIFKIMPYFRAAASVVAGLVILTALGFSFIYPFLCTPVQKLFYPDIEGKCLSAVTVGITNGSINILTDVLTLCLPFPQVWTLPLKVMEKITVSIAFALGLFVVFASSYRIYALVNYDPNDNTYALVPLAGWSLIDCFAAILSACLPVMKPVLLFLLDKLRLRGDKSILARWQRGKKSSKDGRKSWTETETTLAAASFARKSLGPKGSVDGICLNYTDARKHWSGGAETLRGDLPIIGGGGERGRDDDDEDDALEAAHYYQTTSVLKSDI